MSVWAPDELAIIVPVLGRPHRVKPTLESAAAATPGAHVLFIATNTDFDEMDALEAAGADYITTPPRYGYARKITTGVERTAEPLIFTAADDLDFHPGWFEAATPHLGNGCEVVGTNDLCNPRTIAGTHATHFLMTREYAERPTVDGGAGPFHHGYHHWYCDDELVATARRRQAIRFALDAEVEHLHPLTGAAPDDATYRKGREQRKWDQRLFHARKSLWR